MFKTLALSAVLALAAASAHATLTTNVLTSNALTSNALSDGAALRGARVIAIEFAPASK
jgi:hypothetical protein